MTKTNQAKTTTQTKKEDKVMKKQIEKKIAHSEPKHKTPKNIETEKKVEASYEEIGIKRPTPKTEKKVEKAAVETKVVEKKENAKKTNNAVPQLTNDQMKELFTTNGCATYTRASNGSKVVYNTFGTKSRVLQQGKAYQLLLTNGHADKKGAIIETDNDDTARFVEWYNGLTDEQKKWVNGFEDIYKTKLAASEMPRERTVKITNYDLLCEFIKYMATFKENQIAQ